MATRTHTLSIPTITAKQNKKKRTECKIKTISNISIIFFLNLRFIILKWKNTVFEEPDTASQRITSHGYRYLPVHRETYGYSPRPIYQHNYKYTDRPVSSNFKIAEAEKAFKEHLQRMKEIDRRYPSRYGLYLKDKPHTLLPQDVEYEPESKPYH